MGGVERSGDSGGGGRMAGLAVRGGGGGGGLVAATSHQISAQLGSDHQTDNSGPMDLSSGGACTNNNTNSINNIDNSSDCNSNGTAFAGLAG